MPSHTERRSTDASKRTDRVRLELDEAEDVDAVVLAFRRGEELVELAEVSPPVVAELATGPPE